MTVNAVPNKAVAGVIPGVMQSIDPATGIANAIGTCKYTQLTTSGTTTVSPNPCVFYQALCVVLATSTGGVTILDGTNTIGPTATQTAVGSPTGFSGVAPLGIRCVTSLVVITTGTAANTWNILWD